MNLISVLIPSRRRRKELISSIFSLWGNSNQRDIEFIVAIDNDDTETYKDIMEFKDLPVKFLTVERFGYKQFNKYVNLLAENATGQWLFLWNDDARMCSRDWDLVISSFDPSIPQVLNPSGDGVCIFPVVSRITYKILGHFSQSPHCDSYITDMLHPLGLHQRLHTIQAHHLRDDMHDQTKSESQDCYKTTSVEFYEEKIQNLIELDREKIRKFMLTRPN